MRPFLLLLVPALAASTGCGTATTQITTFQCVPQGQTPPTDCAFVQAVARDPNGNPLGFLAVRVDSMVPAIGQAYVSGSTNTAGDGGFVLLVLRTNRFEQPHSPDTATIYIKGYAAADPPIGAQAVSRAAMVMRFSPLGETMTPTVGVAVFHPLPTP
jgi:hypothetical protein